MATGGGAAPFYAVPSVFFAVPRGIHYAGKSLISLENLLLLAGLVALGAIVVTNRVFVAWYQNRQPERWLRILWLLFLVTVPYVVLISYWLMYRRLDDVDKRRIAPAGRRMITRVIWTSASH